MNLFDRTVTEALRNQPHLSPLRAVVEKELLHHDILRILSQNNLLVDLTFIGGTCLRACYGGVRLSEDLDFTGGKHFSRDCLAHMGQLLIEHLYEKYSLKVEVGEPVKAIKNVSTWKIKVETRPKQRHLSAQRIHIDLCAVPSYEKRWMIVQNLYGVDMGTSGLMIQAQSREEIYTDKLLAFALRPNRLKYRDVWDIVWLHQQGVKPNLAYIAPKLHDRKLTHNYFLKQFNMRQRLLVDDPTLSSSFEREMRRFLSSEQVQQTIENGQLWSFFVYWMEVLGEQLKKFAF